MMIFGRFGIQGKLPGREGARLVDGSAEHGVLNRAIVWLG
jgi:hypothetical protein